MGIMHIDMRGRAIGREHVDRCHDTVGKISMQIVADTDGNGVPDGGSDRAQKIALGVFKAIDIGCPVHHQINAIDRGRLTKTVKQRLF